MPDDSKRSIATVHGSSTTPAAENPREQAATIRLAFGPRPLVAKPVRALVAVGFAGWIRDRWCVPVIDLSV